MLIDPDCLATDLARLEAIEKATARLVTQAVCDFREAAVEIFQAEKDLAADIGEDITREALDRMGVSRIDERLFGKIDYKKAHYLFHPDFAVRQALFVDSKAERTEGQATATLQTAQTSMRIRQYRKGAAIDQQGKLPSVIQTPKARYLTTTVFVKYNYEVVQEENRLRSIIVATLPNGWLQDIYNPNANDTIWLVGRNAPTLGEEFRVRLKFDLLKAKCNWRVQRIPAPPDPFYWDD
jgi:hypothetical protein